VSPGPALVTQRLSKDYGSGRGLFELDLEVRSGEILGFLGPNGAGKSTTLRALLGLVRPSSGSATFGGLRYDELDQPSTHVGAVLEDASFHPGRSARNHLRVLALIAGHPESRVDEVLETVGLTDAADRPVKGYSLGMRQRLAIAAALLGKPDVLILDEPTNGLDPPGISWLRGLLRAEAARGAAVLISSHVLAEVALSVDDVVVIAGGKLRAQGTLEQVLGGEDGPATEVRAQDPERLSSALQSRGHNVQRAGDVLSVMGASPEQVGEIAGQEGVAVLGLAAKERSLEEAFLALTGATS
jgi:ABC-2 type transport system ATP-binding protein